MIKLGRNLVLIINIIGCRNVSFTDQNTGNDIIGKTYYYMYEDSNVSGYASDKFFITARIDDPFIVGRSYEVVYNRYGKFDFSKVRECV